MTPEQIKKAKQLIRWADSWTDDETYNPDPDYKEWVDEARPLLEEIVEEAES